MIDDKLREELSALVDGALPGERAEELRRRIREDRDLAREYAELERAASAVRALPRRGAPPELRARLDAALRPRRGRILRLGALAAAATVLLAAGLALYLGRGGPPPRHFEAKDEEPAMGREKKALDQPAAQAEAAAHAPEEKEVNVLKDARNEAAKEGAKLGQSRGTPAKKQEEPDLLAAVARSRKVPAADRKAYLRQVAALDPGKAREHVRAVVGDEVGARSREQARDAAMPVLATIRLEDREEANLLRKILGSPAAANQATALAVEKAKDDAVTAEVTGTDDELSRLGRWLALLDVSRPAPAPPRVTVFGEAKREAGAGKEIRTALVRITIGKAPPQEPEPAPPKEDR
ncbi:MAG TPA: hypothetical protein VFY93_09175 [Planctomycetota bacterium]|nr:hypothetical protein [Planctomycetota bacterium]